MSYDQAAEHLYREGYPVANEDGRYDVNVLHDRIMEELAGNKVYSDRNDTWMAERLQERGEPPLEPAEAAAVDAARANPAANNMHEMDKAYAGMIREAVRAGIPDADRESLIDRYDDAKNDDERMALFNELREKIREQRQSDTGTGEKSANIELTGETPAEATTRVERERSAAAAEQLAIRNADERARADRERDQLSLTGSDRPSDANPGQKDLFANKEGPTEGERHEPSPVERALEDHPNMEIPDAHGNMVEAAPVIEQAAELEKQADKEADPAFRAAVQCFGREA
jgi:hypothetical protein